MKEYVQEGRILAALLGILDAGAGGLRSLYRETVSYIFINPG